ncbi:DNA cytosine methyltransferase [uncultured Pontibacter sp.]|uniref:DNA cytosine methyltransferase n=1 Tax=uncultured Pontibacter sp. TaxID=453356 RepID=UPI00261386A0|nr:DNA cytosine methyltransferase [uncultured Pontibacter sp.]
MAFRVIDLFSGAGGFTLGFNMFKDSFGNSAFKSIWANDFNKESVETYNLNFGSHCVLGDIVDIINNPEFTIPQADIVIGGPPCQGFSLLNKNRKLDPRKQLWHPFMEVVDKSNASVFVMENVKELLKSVEFNEIKVEAERLGFQVKAAKLLAADYGVPQMRYRAFIFGSKIGDPALFFPPKRTHRDPNDKKPIDVYEYVSNPRPWNTVRYAIEDLPEPVGTEIRDEDGPLNIHFGRNPTQLSLERYRAIPDEGMNRFDLQRLAPELTPQCWIKKESGGTDLFGRLWWDRPSVTIRTEFFKPEKGRYLHPVQHRPITHREAARIQSFPDDFIFAGSKTEIARQIGNAVPPILAHHIAKSVYNHLKKQTSLVLDCQMNYG